MASRATAAPQVVQLRAAVEPTTSQAARPVSARRHTAWLVGGMVGAFLVPFIAADQLGIPRDVYYAMYAGAVFALFVAWARDTHQPLREMFARRWPLAVGLGVSFAAISALITTRADSGTDHPDGIEFIAAIGWRGIVYGAADGLLLSAFPILLSAARAASTPRSGACAAFRAACRSAYGVWAGASGTPLRLRCRCRSPSRRCSRCCHSARASRRSRATTSTTTSSTPGSKRWRASRWAPMPNA
jgi:hypothetical protein